MKLAGVKIAHLIFGFKDLVLVEILSFIFKFLDDVALYEVKFCHNCKLSSHGYGIGAGFFFADFLSLRVCW